MDIIIRKTVKKDLRSIKKLARKTISHNYTPFLGEDRTAALIASSASDREIDRGWRRGFTALASDFKQV